MLQRCYSTVGWQTLGPKGANRYLKFASLSTKPTASHFSNGLWQLCARFRLTPLPIALVEFQATHSESAPKARREADGAAGQAKPRLLPERKQPLVSRTNLHRRRVIFLNGWYWSKQFLTVAVDQTTTTTIRTQQKIIYKRNWNNLWFKKALKHIFFTTNFVFALFSISSSNCFSAASSHLQLGRSSGSFKVSVA